MSTLRSVLDQYRGNIPLYFLLGWIAVESDGQNDEVTNLDERGYFQIHPSESKDLGLDHQRLTTDPTYSIQSGIKLVRYYAKIASSEGFEGEQEFFWRMVKLNHAMGTDSVANFIKDMKSHDFNPSGWSAVTSYAAANRARLRVDLKHDPVKWINSVDKVFIQGRELAAHK